ncbi:MAG: sulfatase [Pirellulaceae bacterium]
MNRFECHGRTNTLKFIRLLSICGFYFICGVANQLPAGEGYQPREQDASSPKSQELDRNETQGQPVKGKPNILFIAVDDLRPSLGCYGDPIAKTPNIDQLSNRGVQFNRAYCQVAVCNPSRASLMTGLRPDTLGVWTLPIHFREAKPDAVTLPQWLRKSGYTAVSHGKIYHNPTPDPQSWSEPIRKRRKLPYFYPDGTRDLIQDEMKRLPSKDWRQNNLRGPSAASPDLPDQQLLDGAQTDLCIEDLRRLAKCEEPFFLAMGYIRPHLSFVAPKKYWDLYDPALLPVPIDEQIPKGAPQFALHNNSEFSHYVDLIDMPKPWEKATVELASATRLMHGYYACVSYVDAQIGRLLNALEEEGLGENTIVILWSDHGYKLGEYRGWGKMTNYEIDTRVPFIISAPAMDDTRGQSSDSMVELLDIYPTLCELVGIESPAFAEGKSLFPILQDTDTTVRRAAVSQYFRRHEGEEFMGYTARTKDYRYVEWRDFSTGEIKETELYDHRAKPTSSLGVMERENLAKSAAPELLKELSSLLQETHPPRKLSLTPIVHTNPSGLDRLPVRCRFENAYDGMITVYNIKTSGARARGKQLQPGESITYNARIGGVFVIESNDGLIHEIHSPCWPASSIVIGDRN